VRRSTAIVYPADIEYAVRKGGAMTEPVRMQVFSDYV
jgi:hypothetical protein